MIINYLFSASLIFMFLIFLYNVFLSDKKNDCDQTIKQQTFTWNLSNNRSTKIISNQRLAALQTSKHQGGTLCPNDLIIVWAQQFLDHDILYKTVLNNIHEGIKYLYFLDKKHVGNFRILLKRLYDDIEDKAIVDDGMDVIFLRPELTMNNFVMFAAGSSRQRFYSSLIFEKRPFGWLRQHPFREKLFLLETKRMIARVGFLQYLTQNKSDLILLLSQVETLNRHYLIDLQLMDFSHTLNYQELVNNMPDDNKLNIEDNQFVHIDLSHICSLTTLPEDAEDRVDNITDLLKYRAG